MYGLLQRRACVLLVAQWVLALASFEAQVLQEHASQPWEGHEIYMDDDYLALAAADVRTPRFTAPEQRVIQRRQRVLMRQLLQAKAAGSAGTKGNTEYPRQSDTVCPSSLEAGGELRIVQTCTLADLPARLDRPGASMVGVMAQLSSTTMIPVVIVPDVAMQTAIQPGED